MVNKVILIGNLGQDPEVRTTNSGLTVANMRLATSERTKDRATGEWTEHTEWHTVAAFGRTAEVLQQYAQKGRRLYIEGRLRTREWTDKEGGKRWSTEVIADRMQLLGSRDGGGQSGGGGYSGGQSSGGYSGGQSSGQQDDGIPF